MHMCKTGGRDAEDFADPSVWFPRIFGPLLSKDPRRNFRGLIRIPRMCSYIGRLFHSPKDSFVIQFIGILAPTQTSL